MKNTFADLGLGAPLLAELASLGYEEPTPIQQAAAEPLLGGKDLLGQAATGTGKTAAFALPLLQRISSSRPEPGKPLVLVLVPTRELAVQVSEAFHRYGRSMGIAVAPIYGGQEFRRQIMALQRGAHVVVATPGRVLDHMRRSTIDLSGLQSVVLDEADEMLDMGFAEDLELILEAAPEQRQTALFSATLPPRIARIAERHLRDPVRVLIPRDAAKKGAMPKVRQTAYIVPRAHKITALGRVLDLENPSLAIIFCRTRLEVDELAQRLGGRGYAVEALHGGMSQNERDRVMKRARAATVDLLVATDVAARGIDIDHLSHVVNFDVPSSPEAYVHRIGRTGRAGREGVAITLAEPREHRLLRNIEWITKQKFEIGTVPTPMDVKARRLDLTKGSLREAVLAGELDSYRSVAEALAGEYDLMDVAAAAVKLAHEAMNGNNTADGERAREDSAHIPQFENASRPLVPKRAFERRDEPRFEPKAPPRPPAEPAPENRPMPAAPEWAAPPPNVAPQPAQSPAQDQAAPTEPSTKKKSKDKGKDNAKSKQELPSPLAAFASQPYAKPALDKAGKGKFAKGDAKQKAPFNPSGQGSHGGPLVRIYIGAGRQLGLRPADLVGAIANEAQINARGIGDIEIADTYSLVELPEADAERVVQALRGTTLRGRKVTVKRDQGRR